MSFKGASCFNILECGRNQLYKLDVTYQRAFTASEKPSSVPTGYYELSPARERYYDICADHIKEKNVRMDNYEIRKAISRVKLEDEEEHERNIEYMVQDDDCKSPWKIKYAAVATDLMRSQIQVIRMKSLQQEKSQSQILKL